MIEKNVIVNNLNIHFFQSERLAAGALIFLHGWGSEAAHMKSIFEKSENFVAIDLPGFGKSERPGNTWTTSDYADFLNNFLLKLKIENPTLVGHSFGGSVIIKFCSTYGEVGKIILIGSAGIRRKSNRLFFYWIGAKIFNAIFSLPPLSELKKSLRKKFYKSIGSEDYLNSGEMKKTFQKVIDEDLSLDMQRIKAQVILIWGEDDKETPIADAEKISELIDKSKLFVIPNAGHYVFLDQKNKFNKIFFEQIV